MDLEGEVDCASVERQNARAGRAASINRNQKAVTVTDRPTDL